MTGEHRAGFRPDIEGIRAIAILLVVAFHAGLPIDGGYVGVDVFFVVSGYLITGLMHHEWEATGRLSLLRFYARRARRLVPAAALTTVATLAVAYALYSPAETRNFAEVGRSVTVYLGNFVFANDATDYFRLDHVNPLLHTWSLAVEEQFYLVWPVLFVGLTWAATRRRLDGTRVLIAGVAIVSVASLAFCVVMTERVLPVAFYLAPSRFWEFGIGALIALIPMRRHLPRLLVKLMAIGGLGAIAYAAWSFHAETPFPGFYAAIPAVGTALLLRAGAIGDTSPVRQVLGAGPMQWVGRHSYAWYLWHWPFIVFTRLIWPDASTTMVVASAVVALGAAVLTRILVEDPVRFHPRLTTRPTLSLGIAGTVIAGSLALVFAVGAVAHWTANRGEQRVYTQAHELPQFNSSRCGVGIRATEPRDDCVFGDPNGAETIVLFGDSHAVQWLPAVDAMAKQRHWQLRVFSKFSCPTADVPKLRNQALRRQYTECITFRARSIETILEMKPRFVITGNSEIAVPAGRGVFLGINLQQWRAGMRATAEVFDRAGINHVALVDTPDAGFDVPLCLARRAHALVGKPSCTFTRRHSVNDEGQQALVDAVAGLRHARLVTMNDLICATKMCPVVVNDVIVYRDGNHLTDAFVETLAEPFAQRVAIF